MIKKGFKLDLTDRKRSQPAKILSRSSSARDNNREDDLMSSSYSQGFDGHQNASGFTNLETLENKPINIKFKKQIKDNMISSRHQENDLQKQVNKLDGIEVGVKKNVVAGHYGGQVIPPIIKRRTKSRFEDELQHPNKRDKIFFAEEGE